ncbi:Bifunctional protein FolD 1 [Nymphaea thermarum]|nr:Bifunctional protein FolD 1 [Nymphaea thermarum]
MMMHTFLLRTIRAVAEPIMAVVSTTRPQIPSSYFHSAATRSKQYNRPPVLGLDLPDVWTLRKDGPASSCQRHDDANTLLHTRVIDGSSIAEEIRSEIADEVCKMKDSIGKVPGLAVVLVGSRKDSETYVRNKIKACGEVGIRSYTAELHEDCTEKEVFSVVSRFNDDPSVHGVLVQLPLPKRHHATVSIVHAFTENPEEVTREADILISAAGVGNLVRRRWLKPGAVVIDVGTNPVEDPDSERGYRLIGDVCYEEALGLVSAITPVPGGVGPMTVAMLLSNTLDSAKRAYGFI